MIEPSKNGAHYIYRPEDVDNKPKKICAYDNITHHTGSVRILQNHSFYYAGIEHFISYLFWVAYVAIKFSKQAKESFHHYYYVDVKSDFSDLQSLLIQI